MNTSSEAYIEECLKYHELSSADSESDPSSGCQSEIDDEYYRITDKPIPADELRSKTINPLILEQWDSNRNVWNRQPITNTIENLATSSSNFKTCNNNLSDLINTTSRDIQIYNASETQEHVNDSGNKEEQEEHIKPISTNNEVDENNTIKQKEKKNKKKKLNQEPNQNVWKDYLQYVQRNYSSDDELYEKQVRTHSKHKENDFGPKRRLSKTNNKKKKNAAKKMNTSIEQKCNNIPVTKKPTAHIITNNNNEYIESWILYNKKLLPTREIPEKSSRNGNTKVLMSTYEKHIKSRGAKCRKQENDYEDNNFYPWRTNGSILYSLSFIVGFLKYHKAKRVKPEKRNQEKIFNLPINKQTNIFPILHKTPRIVIIGESRARLYEELFDVTINIVVVETLRILRSEFSSKLDAAAVHLILKESMKWFGLTIKRKLFAVTLKFDVDSCGVWLNVKTKNSLKYSRFRIVCK